MRAHEYQRAAVSRLEERDPQGWLGQVRTDPGDVSDRGWNQPDEPDPWASLNQARP